MRSITAGRPSTDEASKTPRRDRSRPSPGAPGAGRSPGRIWCRVVLLGRDIIDHTLASRSTAVRAGHGRLGVAFVEEDKPLRVDRSHPLDPLLPLCEHPGVELLLGSHGPFLRVISNRGTARQMVIGQPWNSVASRNSWRVASGRSAPAARSASAASPWIKSLRPSPLGFGAIEPVAVRRAMSFRIHRAETSNLLAVCSWVSSPSFTAAKTAPATRSNMQPYRASLLGT
jgi:hypothetical protein